MQVKASLKNYGFPIEGKNVVFMLKPSKKYSDGDYKSNAAKEIAKLGTVAGLFENQPKNLALLYKVFPKATPIFLDTNFNPSDPTVLGKEYTKIKEYKFEK
jgi:hypothetical protein